MTSVVRLLVGVVAVLVLAGPAAAQEDRLRQQLSDAIARVQTLQAENARLEGRIRALEDHLNASQSRARALEGSVYRAQSQARELVAAVEERAGLAANSRERIAQAQRQALEARREAAAARSALAALQEQTEPMRQSFDRQAGLIEIAKQKNEALVSIGEEIVVALEQQCFGARLLAREPVTQLYRVRLENEIQDFRKKVSDQRFFPQTETVEPVPSAQGEELAQPSQDAPSAL